MMLEINTYIYGCSSVIEAAPQDTQVLRGCRLNPTESSHWALAPHVCSNPPRNREQPVALYGSLALKACYFSALKHVRQPRDFNYKHILVAPSDSSRSIELLQKFNRAMESLPQLQCHRKPINLHSIQECCRNIGFWHKTHSKPPCSCRHELPHSMLICTLSDSR